MKTTIFLLIFGICTNILIAQNESKKGETSVGVSGLPLFFRTEEGNVEFSGMALKASLGVFVSNRFSIENNLFYYQNKDVLLDGGKVQSQSYGLQLSLRYHMPLGEKVIIYIDGGGGFGSISYQSNYNLTSLDYSFFDSGIVLLTIGLGTRIRIYKGLDFELMLPYLAVYHSANENNIYGREDGLLYNSLAGPNPGLRYTF